MNLIIDVGNTRIKLAVYQNSTLVTLVTSAKEDVLEVLQKLIESYPAIQKSIISSVGNFPAIAIDLLQKHMTVLVLTSETVVSLANEYSTPKTLGVD